MPRWFSQLILDLVLFFFALPALVFAQTGRTSTWSVESVDTMKYSRDLARQELSDPAFDQIIDRQISAIASTGATHVAVDTPYDNEFLPFLTRWVSSARAHGLKVWFRGNWSGWEGWFNYPKISRADHLALTRAFILNHAGLFADGDIFTSCPECENGGPGDPRVTGDVDGFRRFLIDLYHTSSSAFSAIHKQVITNYFSQNGDVARLVMNRSTTSQLGGVITLDHYVSTPEQLSADISGFITSSGARQVVLGEFGVPVPDINGGMTQLNQADWLNSALKLLAADPRVIGLNYWTSFGSSTSLWDSDGQPRLGVLVLTHFYTPRQITFIIKDEFGYPLPSAVITYAHRQFTADSRGRIRLPYIVGIDQAAVSAPGFQSQGVYLGSDTAQFNLSLAPAHPGFLYRLRQLIFQIKSDILNL